MLAKLILILVLGSSILMLAYVILRFIYTDIISIKAAEIAELREEADRLERYLEKLKEGKQL